MPVPDPRDGVPLLARRVQIRLQYLVDRRLERIQRGRSFITKRIQRLTVSHAVRSKLMNNDFTGTGPRSHSASNRGQLSRAEPCVIICWRRLKTSFPGEASATGVVPKPA
jgi:hypothetical protein